MFHFFEFKFNKSLVKFELERMHNNAEFLSTLNSNAYEFDKREMRFNLRKSAVTFAKKVNGTFIA